MKSATHKLTEQILAVLGPIFRDNPHYETILQSMSLVMARVVQSTPDKSKEFAVLDAAHEHMSHALNEYLKIEADLESKREARAKVVSRGLDAFSEFAREPVNGDHDNLVAFNGGMGPEAQADAEAYAGEYRHKEGDPDYQGEAFGGSLAEPVAESDGQWDKTEFGFVAKEPVRTAEEDLKDHPDALPAWQPTAAEIAEYLIEEERALADLSQIPAGVTLPDGIFGNPEIFTDPHGQFVNPPGEHPGLVNPEWTTPEKGEGFDAEDVHGADGPRAYL